MKKQILIIGLGQLGMSLTKTLSNKEFEVLAVDIDNNLVNEAATFATDAICLNSIDETSLEKLSPRDRDIVICAIKAKEPSILTVALLKQMGCKNIVARATDSIHSRILKAIGADCIINPDEEYGRKFANKILFQNVFSENTFDDIELREMKVLPNMVDKTLIELALPKRYGLIVAATVKNGEIQKPVPDKKLELGETLLVIGTDEELEKMFKENK